MILGLGDMNEHRHNPSTFVHKSFDTHHES